MSKKVYIVAQENGYLRANFKFEKEMKDVILKFSNEEEKNPIIKYFRKLSLSKSLDEKINFPLRKTLYRTFFDKILLNNDSDDTIIFFDSHFYAKREVFIKWLRKEYPKVKLILWNWNKLKDGNIGRFKKYYNAIYTFDREDSKLYDLKYISSFYSKVTAEIYKSKEAKEGVIFIGYDKGRAPFLKGVKDRLDELKIPYYFHVVKDSTSKVENGIELYDKGLSYEEVLKKTSEFKIVLDLVITGQKGLTLRTLETIFLGKKLITNNPIVQEEELYKTGNILVIENPSDITEEFLRKETLKVENKILDNYSTEGWLKKILM